MATSESSYGIDPADVIAETVDGEVLIINLRDGTYYSSDGTGGVIWSLLVAHASLDDVASRLAVRYAEDPPEIRRAVESFADELLREGLIVPHPRVELLPSDTPAAREPFELPILHKYTDFQELLRLDPIHDADPTAGWPGVKSTN